VSEGIDRTTAQAARPSGIDRATRALALVVPAALLGVLPFLVNDYQQFVANTMLVYCVVTVGFNVILGYLGQLAFASAAFFGVGAYGAGLSMVHMGAPLPGAIVLAGLAGAVAGTIVALPAMRVRGYYLAIITLGFGELMRWIYVHADAVTFGPSGFNIPLPTLLGLSVRSEGRKFYLFLFVAVLAIGATARLLRSRFGRAFVAVRDNELAAASLGISVARTKVIAFAWSGFIIGLAGGLYAVLNGRVTPDSFGLAQMLLHFALVMIGGLGSLLGSLIGAILLTAAPELLRNFAGAEEIVFSLLLIAVLFFVPKGLGGLLARGAPALRERLYRG
jgi:branched-chain amino acid transport system permease protein